jgi:hypothetical protein
MTTGIGSGAPRAARGTLETLARGAANTRREAVVVAALVLGGCGDRAVPPASSSSSAGTAASASATPGPAASTSRRRADPRWRAALDGDEARAAELASDLAVDELAAALGDEDAVRGVAIRALPYARDRDATLGALAVALDHGRGDEASVADAIERTLAAQRRDTEVPSRDGARACSAALVRVAAAGGKGGLVAARAESLARRVGE